MGRTLRLHTGCLVLWDDSSIYHHVGAIMVIGDYELRTDGFSGRKDIVYRKLGTKDCSIPICRIYGETDAIRERIFKTLFTDYPYGRGIMHYSPLAHASVKPIPQSHPEAPEVFGYDVREGVSKDKLLGCGCYGWL